MSSKSLKLLVIAFFWIMILIYSKHVATVNVGSSTIIYVDPYESHGIVGQNFTINICISDVVDLYGWEFRLGWNSTILEAVGVFEGQFLKTGGDTFFTYKVNNTLGYMIVDCTLLGDVPGVSGDGVLATVKFYVESVGECLLDLYDTILINSAEQAIEHAEADGYYSTSMHDVAIIGLTASSTEVNVTVENQGTYTETFNVSVYYTRLFDPLIGTQTITLEAGASSTLSFNWTPPTYGRYEIRAEASTVPGEVDTVDNVQTITIFINCEALNPSSSADEMSVTIKQRETLYLITVFGRYVISWRAGLD